MKFAFLICAFWLLPLGANAEQTFTTTKKVLDLYDQASPLNRKFLVQQVECVEDGFTWANASYHRSKLQYV